MAFNTFYDFLKGNAQKYTDHTAILYDTLAVTYPQLFHDVCRKAIHLKKFDGKRIALIGPASYRWIVNFFGAVIAGKEIVLLDSFMSRQERRILLNKVKPDYILSSAFQYILSDCTGAMIPNAADDDKNIEGITVEDGTPEGNIILFTSGTCEFSKAAILSSWNLNFSMLQVAGAIHCSSDDKVLSLMPLHHVFGLVYSILWPLHSGACVCIGRGIKHIDFDTIYYQPSVLPIYPALLEGLMNLEAINPQLKTIVIGESTCPASVIRQLEDMKIQTFTVYGLTAASGGIAVASKASRYELVPYADTHITIAEDGEILIQSDGIMTGYDADEIATAKVLHDGYLYSGDLGFLNEAGHLIITGSKKNILALPNGEKINCNEAEEFFNNNAQVLESALTLKDRTTTIYIYSNQEAFSDDTAQKLVETYNKTKSVSRRINHFILVREPLPKNTAGLIDRWALV